MSKEEPFIFKDLSSVTGGDHHSKLYTVTNIHENDTEVVVEYAVSKRYPIQELEQARRDYEILNGSGYVLTLDQFLDLKRFRQHPAPTPPIKGKE